MAVARDQASVEAAIVTMQTISTVAASRVDQLQSALERALPDGEAQPAPLLDHALSLIVSCCDRYGDAKNRRDPVLGATAIADMLNASLVLRKLLALDGVCDCPKCAQIRKQLWDDTSEKSA